MNEDVMEDFEDTPMNNKWWTRFLWFMTLLAILILACFTFQLFHQPRPPVASDLSGAK